MQAIEFAGRNCYASQDKITENSYQKFLASLIRRGHGSPLEFADVTFDLTTSRAVLAELTRHRLASYCVESQRYIQEASTGSITFIRPEWVRQEAVEGNIRMTNAEQQWFETTQAAEDAYKVLIAEGKSPEEAHGPNVILQKYEVHRFSKQIRVIGADFPQPLQGGFLWNWKLFQCG